MKKVVTMTRRSSTWLLLLGLVSCLAMAQAPLKILSHELKPLSWQAEGRSQGAIYDLVQATQLELGVAYPTQFLPFKRGLYLTQTNPGYLFFPCLRIPEREAKFKWVGPLLKSRGVLYQLAHQPLVQSLEELYALRQIGVLLGSSSDDYLTSLGLTNLRRLHSREESLHLLDMQRIDAVVMVDTALPPLLQALQLPAERIVASPVELFHGDYYLAFSLATPDEEIQRWQQALNTVLRAQGATIFARYYLAPPAVSPEERP